MKKIVPNNAVLIPDDATRVFEGQIFDVYQWPQRLFDGSTVTYELLKRPDTVQIIAIKDDKIVVLDEQQSGRPSFLRLPGGRVEPGEPWLDAAKRECKEELGMEFTDWHFVIVRQPIVKIEWFVATFLTTNLSSQQQKSPDAGERISLLELSLEEWKRRLVAENSPLADYAKGFFASITSLGQLLAMPEFQGKEVDRP